MKFVIRTPGPNFYGDERMHAVVRTNSRRQRSVCGKTVRAWRKVNDGEVTCLKCLAVLRKQGVAS